MKLTVCFDAPVNRDPNRLMFLPKPQRLPHQLDVLRSRVLTGWAALMEDKHVRAGDQDPILLDGQQAAAAQREAEPGDGGVDVAGDGGVHDDHRAEERVLVPFQALRGVVVQREPGEPVLDGVRRVVLVVEEVLGPPPAVLLVEDEPERCVWDGFGIHGRWFMDKV